MTTSQFRPIFSLVVILLNSLMAQATVEAVIGDVPLSQNINLAVEPTTSNPEILISRDQYVISYNKVRRAPNWVAWRLTANQIGSSGRSNAFAQDADLEIYLSKNDPGVQAVQPSDYSGSCFDRGHQIPSEDRTDSSADNVRTFVMSNMIPQTPYLNRVIWEHLEQYTRDFTQQQGKVVYVIDGPIYDVEIGSIGPNKDIPVPSRDFKIVIVLDQGQTPADITASTPMVAVVMPNVLQDGSIPVPYETNCGGSSTLIKQASTTDWQQYETTVSEIESLSGFSFHLPFTSNVQTKLGSSFHPNF